MILTFWFELEQVLTQDLEDIYHFLLQPLGVRVSQIHLSQISVVQL